MQLIKQAQNNLPRIIGVLLFFTPFIFGTVTITSSFWAAWALGGVISVIAVAIALFWLGFPRNPIVEAMTVLIGLVFFITPWFLSTSWLNAGVLASSILGVFFVIAAGGMLEKDWSSQARVATQSHSRELATSHGYRRVTNSL